MVSGEFFFQSLVEVAPSTYYQVSSSLPHRERWVRHKFQALLLLIVGWSDQGSHLQNQGQRIAVTAVFHGFWLRDCFSIIQFQAVFNGKVTDDSPLQFNNIWSLGQEDGQLLPEILHTASNRKPTVFWGPEGLSYPGPPAEIAESQNWILWLTWKGEGEQVTLGHPFQAPWRMCITISNPEPVHPLLQKRSLASSCKISRATLLYSSVTKKSTSNGPLCWFGTMCGSSFQSELSTICLDSKSVVLSPRSGLELRWRNSWADWLWYSGLLIHAKSTAWSILAWRWIFID